jgi:hypothetical protein
MLDLAKKKLDSESQDWIRKQIKMMVKLGGRLIT